jgi:hypothetical protein
MPSNGKYEEFLSKWHPTLSEYIFLPPWVHWEDLDKPEYAHISDLVYWTIPGTILILVIR